MKTKHSADWNPDVICDVVRLAVEYPVYPKIWLWYYIDSAGILIPYIFSLKSKFELNVLPWLLLVANGFLMTEFVRSPFSVIVVWWSTFLVNPFKFAFIGPSSVVVSGKLLSKVLALTNELWKSSLVFLWAKSKVRK